MRTLAVTGATGFIGRRLVAAALDRGWTVRALVRDGKHLSPAAGLTIAPWDALDAAGTADRLLGADVVCHLAAFIPPDLSDPSFAERCFQVNVLGTLGLLAAAAEAGIARFVHLSSGNAYAPAAGLVEESHPLYPSRRAPYYLASKVAGEVMVDHWRHAGRLASCILRLASVYGPGMPGGVVRTSAGRLRRGQPILLQDGGRHAMDLVFVDDVVAAVLAAAAGEAVGPFNIGSGVRTTTAELARLLVELTGAASELVQVEPAPTGAGEAVGFAALDITRARAELDHRPIGLREGLERTIGAL